MKTKESSNRESLGNAAASSAMVMEENNREADIDVSILPDSIRENYFTPSQKGSDYEEDDEIEAGAEWDGEEEETSEDVEQVTVIDPDTSRLVAEINKIAQRTVERGKMEIGQYILKNVFDGDIQEVLARNPNKSRSLRAICSHPDLMVDHRKLGSWVKAAALRLDLEGNGLDVSKLSFTHFVILLRVGSPEKRIELARKIVKKGMSMKETLDAVNVIKRKAMPSKGKEMLKKLADPLKLFNDADYKDLLSNRERMEEEFDSEDRLRLIKELERRAGEVAEVNQFLETSKKNLLAIEIEKLSGS
jgi:hypothetical protein